MLPLCSLSNYLPQSEQDLRTCASSCPLSQKGSFDPCAAGAAVARPGFCCLFGNMLIVCAFQERGIRRSPAADWLRRIQAPLASGWRSMLTHTKKQLTQIHTHARTHTSTQTNKNNARKQPLAIVTLLAQLLESLLKQLLALLVLIPAAVFNTNYAHAYAVLLMYSCICWHFWHPVSF